MPYYQDVYDHVLRATEWTESLRDLVTTILETNLTIQGNRMNVITKKVTSWAAIIAVPTFITGFYGMNVPYPGFGETVGLHRLGRHHDRGRVRALLRVPAQGLAVGGPVPWPGSGRGEAGGPVRDRGDLGLPGKHLVQQHPVHLGIGVQAAVRQDGQPVVQVGGLAQGGQHHPAGGDAGQHQVLDAAGAQQHLQVAAGEGGHPALGDHHLAGRGCHGGGDVGAGVTVGEPAGPGDRAMAAIGHLREQYGAALITRLKQGVQLKDLIATSTALTAATIALGIDRFIQPRMRVDELIASGGGVHNRTLMAYLQAFLPGIRIMRTDEFGIDPDAKEAVAFAVLAYETWRRHPSNLPSATGAKRAVILGKVTY